MQAWTNPPGGGGHCCLGSNCLGGGGYCCRGCNCLGGRGADTVPTFQGIQYSYYSVSSALSHHYRVTVYASIKVQFGLQVPPFLILIYQLCIY